MTSEQRAVELTDEWRAALTAYETNDTARNFHREQETYDALIDHIEESGLNGSDLDPRGS